MYHSWHTYDAKHLFIYFICHLLNFLWLMYKRALASPRSSRFSPMSSPRSFMVLHLGLWSIWINIYLFGCAKSYWWHVGSMLLRHAESLVMGFWDLVPWPQIKPRPPCSGSQNLSHWATTKVSDSLTLVTQTHMRDTIKNQPNYCILLGPWRL